MDRIGMKQVLGLSCAVRVGLMFYGTWQDDNMEVKFTDVDYSVFSDAASFVTQGKSPYLRPTYRYTPILAWLLTLNSWLSPLFGKVIFILFDLFVGHMIYILLVRLGHTQTMSRNCSLLWLCNPLSATVSSRGNAESIMAFLVIVTLFYLLNGQTVMAAVFYALSIHFKIYPIIYALPIYLYLGEEESDEGRSVKDYSRKNLHQSRGNIKNRLKAMVIKLLPNRERLLFAAVSVTVLGSLTLVFYVMYGWVFLYETYLYHVIRGDIRHNFSPYFYMLYLSTDPVLGVPLYLRLLVFVPQMVVLLTISVTYYKNPPLCWFLSTFVFVMGNKVCTSQYFLWYLSLLPLIAPNLRLSLRQGLAILSAWFGGQGLWLLPAYYLEFKGYNTFLYIWAAGMLFFVINAGIVCIVVMRYTHITHKQHQQ